MNEEALVFEWALVAPKPDFEATKKVVIDDLNISQIRIDATLRINAPGDGVLLKGSFTRDMLTVFANFNQVPPTPCRCATCAMPRTLHSHRLDNLAQPSTRCRSCSTHGELRRPRRSTTRPSRISWHARVGTTCPSRASCRCAISAHLTPSMAFTTVSHLNEQRAPLDHPADRLFRLLLPRLPRSPRSRWPRVYSGARARPSEPTMTPAACPHPRRLPLGGPSFQSVCVC